MTVPLSRLNPGDTIGLFVGPQTGVNYIGTDAPTCTITLVGTGTVSIQYNITTLMVGGVATPNPNAWLTLRTISVSGSTTVALTPRSVQNWVQIVVATPGTGTCDIAATWAPPGSVIDPLIYRGTWNAATNTPTLASGVGLNGGYYVVIVPGSTSLDGISSWSVGDRLTFNRTAWIKTPGLVVQSP